MKDPERSWIKPYTRTLRMHAIEMAQDAILKLQGHLSNTDLMAREYAGILEHGGRFTVQMKYVWGFDRDTVDLVSQFMKARQPTCDIVVERRYPSIMLSGTTPHCTLEWGIKTLEEFIQEAAT